MTRDGLGTGLELVNEVKTEVEASLDVVMDELITLAAEEMLITDAKTVVSVLNTPEDDEIAEKPVTATAPEELLATDDEVVVSRLIATEGGLITEELVKTPAAEETIPTDAEAVVANLVEILERPDAAIGMTVWVMVLTTSRFVEVVETIRSLLAKPAAALRTDGVEMVEAP